MIITAVGFTTGVCGKSICETNSLTFFVCAPGRRGHFRDFIPLHDKATQPWVANCERLGSWGGLLAVDERVVRETDFPTTGLSVNSSVEDGDRPAVQVDFFDPKQKGVERDRVGRDGSNLAFQKI